MNEYYGFLGENRYYEGGRDRSIVFSGPWLRPPRGSRHQHHYFTLSRSYGRDGFAYERRCCCGASTLLCVSALVLPVEARA